MKQEKSAIGRQVLQQILRCGGFKVNAGDKIKQPLKALVAHFLAIMLMVSIALSATCTIAAEVKITPGLAVGGAYDDNILYSSEQELSSSIVTVSPRLDVDYRTLLSTLRLTADLDILRYLEESDLDRTNQYYRLSGSRRFKERWSTSANFRYYKDTTLNTYLQEIGRVIERVERDYFDAGATVGYSLTDISRLTAGYQYENASYENDTFTDYDNHRGRLYYSHRLKNQIDTLSIGPSYYHRTNDLNEVDSFSLDVGWDRAWSSVTRSDATIGARYVNVDRLDGTEDDNWGAKASVDVTFEGIVTTTTFRYFHDLRTTNEGDDVNVDNLYLSYRRSITERFGAGVNGRLVFSYKLLDKDSNINDSRYYWIEPRLYYQLTQNLNLSLRYRYQNNVEFRDEGDRTRERNTVWLQLSYGLPILM